MKHVGFARKVTGKAVWTSDGVFAGEPYRRPFYGKVSTYEETQKIIRRNRIVVSVLLLVSPTLLYFIKDIAMFIKNLF